MVFELLTARGKIAVKEDYWTVEFGTRDLVCTPPIVMIHKSR